MTSANRATCAHCGVHRRVGGRDPDGLAWCVPCRQQHRGAALDAARRRRIIAVVADADPSLGTELVEAALEATAGARTTLRRLADHLDAHPEVFSTGPTSNMAVLDRFTIALAAAGSTRIATIDPICSRCGRQRRWHARVDGGGECGSCWARVHREPCSVCARPRCVNHRDADGRPVCERCMQHERRLRRLDELAAEIAGVVHRADPAVAVVDIGAALDKLAPNVPARALIARQLGAGPPLSAGVHRLAPVARLLDALRVAGAVLPAATCTDCGEAAQPLVTYRSVVRCLRCARSCPGCGGATKEPTKPWCGRCERGPRGTCGDCGRVDRPLDDNGRCRGCRERVERRCAACDTQAPRTWVQGRWVCQRCALAVDLDCHLGPADALAAPLVVLRDAILAADNPTRVRSWLRDSAAGKVLASVAAGETALTHTALDAFGADHSVMHLRSLLVAVAALPAEDRSINRFEVFAGEQVELIDDSTDRGAVRAWLRWQVLPRLRARDEAGKTMAHSANNARRSVRQVVLLLGIVHGHGRTLRTCTQADLDTWFGAGRSIRWLARPFLVWATARSHLAKGVAVPASPPQALRPVIDAEQRWVVARRLVSDDTISVDIRVVGALVVLYAQPLARVAVLKSSDVHRSSDGTVIVDLAGNPVPIHEPFSTLIGLLPHRRSNGVSDQLDTPWLFPGRHAGHHCGPVILGERLRAIGIEPLLMRNSARAQLAGEIPPAMLGEIIGVNANTATRWAALSGGNWMAYPADLDDR